VQAFLKSRQDVAKDTDKNELVVTSPANGSAYLYMPDPNLRDHQRIPFTANGGSNSTDLHWFVNDNYVGASKSGEPLFWPLTKGMHRVVCSDTHGTSRSVRFSVK
jgi:membrane carboxypeptidase/penicillin-binding protein PbpC